MQVTRSPIRAGASVLLLLALLAGCTNATEETDGSKQEAHVASPGSNIVEQVKPSGYSLQALPDWRRFAERFVVVQVISEDAHVDSYSGHAPGTHVESTLTLRAFVEDNPHAAFDPSGLTPAQMTLAGDGFIADAAGDLQPASPSGVARFDPGTFHLVALQRDEQGDERSEGWRLISQVARVPLALDGSDATEQLRRNTPIDSTPFLRQQFGDWVETETLGPVMDFLTWRGSDSPVPYLAHIVWVFRRAPTYVEGTIVDLEGRDTEQFQDRITVAVTNLHANAASVSDGEHISVRTGSRAARWFEVGMNVGLAITVDDRGSLRADHIHDLSTDLPHRSDGRPQTTFEMCIIDVYGTTGPTALWDAYVSAASDPIDLDQGRPLFLACETPPA